MTKDTITLMHRLVNEEEMYGTEIFELYEKTMKANDLKSLFKLLAELDDKVYDFAFLTQTGKELGVTRNAVNELLSGMCEQVGDSIEIYLQDNPSVVERYYNCPIKTDHVFLSSIPNREYAALELNRSEKNYLKLGEMRVDKTDWYNIYCFELLED